MGKSLGQRLGEAMVEKARKSGLPVITRVIPFLNNDVPEYLENLHRFEEASRRAGKDIKVEVYLFQPAYA
jgi:hypothetical protein